MGNTTTTRNNYSADKDHDIVYHECNNNHCHHECGSWKRTMSIYCIVSAHYHENSTAHHDIVLQFRNNMYDMISTEVNNNVSKSNQGTMKQKVDSILIGGNGCTVQSTKSMTTFIGNISDGQVSWISSVPRNLPGDLVKIPISCLLEIKSETLETYHFIENNGTRICVSGFAIDRIRKNIKKLNHSHNDYLCDKYNYSKGNVVSF